MSDTAILPAPTFGTELNNRATVISYTEMHPGGNGCKRHGTALCHRGGVHPFVTWTIFQECDGTWGAEAGNYQENLIDAVGDYKRRGGK